MRATFLNPGNPFAIEDVEKKAISNNDILLRVESCAICGSDLKIARFGNSRIDTKRTIGHEISGIIEEIGSNVKGYNIGEKVSIGADLPCNQCELCLNGDANKCETNFAIGYQFDGGFAEYVILNQHILNEGPIQKFNNASFDLACLAEPLACAINGVEKSLSCYQNKNINSILIFGGGPMGILLAEYLAFLGNEDIYIAEPQEFRSNFIREHTTFKPYHESQSDIKFDLIFTACPVVETHISAINLIAKSGVINFFGGLPQGSQKVDLNTNHIHYNEIVLTGSHGSAPRHHKEAMRIIEENFIDLEYLITHKFKLEQINQAFDLAYSGMAQKIIINP